MSLYSTFIIRLISTLSQRVALLTERPRMVRIYTSLTSSDLLSPLLLKKRGEREEVFTRSTPWTKERLGSSSHPVSRFVSSRPVSSRRFASRRVASRRVASPSRRRVKRSSSNVCPLLLTRAHSRQRGRPDRQSMPLSFQYSIYSVYI